MARDGTGKKREQLRSLTSPQCNWPRPRPCRWPERVPQWDDGSQIVRFCDLFCHGIAGKRQKRAHRRKTTAARSNDASAWETRKHATRSARHDFSGGYAMCRNPIISEFRDSESMGECRHDMVNRPAFSLQAYALTAYV